MGVALAAGCGGDDESPAADAGVSADAAGDGPDAAGPDASGPSARVWAVGADYMAGVGVLSTVDLPSLAVTKNAVAGVASSDPVVRVFGDRVYVINRFGFDNVTIIDRLTGTLIDQISTGANTNPQDVAVKGDTIYVAALGAGEVIVLDAANPDAAPGAIDISSYDTDGVPDATSIYLVGDKLLVAVGLLDADFVSHGGKVIVIDTTDDTVVGDFDLTHRNPVGWLQPRGADELVIATAENPFQPTTSPGCLERIDVSGTPKAAGCLADNSSLGGTVAGYAAVGDTVYAAITTSDSFDAGKLVAITDAGVSNDSLTAASVQPGDVAACPTGEIVISDRAAGGLRVYGSDGDELTSDAIDIGLPPAFANGIACR
ncbi:MAG: hypothetical protein D6689_12105 [Deltaproteobacteria bacterium]|nr:MAG: hypothetical protein D6689_12105 [Deltaproteobacteria bacterium]